jgi:hypothetical protein
MIHPALLALLRDLQPNPQWNERKRDLFLNAVVAVTEYAYPAEPPELVNISDFLVPKGTA